MGLHKGSGVVIDGVSTSRRLRQQAWTHDHQHVLASAGLRASVTQAGDEGVSGVRYGADAKDWLEAGFCGATGTEVGVDPGGQLAAFGNGPDDERCAAPRVAADEDAVQVRHEIAVALHGPACVVGHAQAVEQAVFDGTGESHRQQHKIRVDRKFTVGHRREGALRKRHARSMQFRDAPVLPGEMRGRHAPLALAAFFMRVGGA